MRVAEVIKETGSIPLWEPWPYEGRPHMYPPLYHVTLAGLSVITGIPISEIIRFFLPIVSSVLILAVFWLVLKFRDEKTALLAAFFIAISPYLISSAYDSPQIIGILLGIFAIYFFLKDHFYKAGILLGFIYLFNPFAAAAFSVPFFAWLILKKATVNIIKTFIIPGIFIGLWYLPRIPLSYCSESILGPYFIIKGMAPLLWQEAVVVLIVLAIFLLITKFASKWKHDRFGKFWLLWVLIFAVFYFSFILTPLLHPWRHGILLAFGFSILLADILTRAKIKEIFILFFAVIFVGGLFILLNLNDFGPALEENEYLMIDWADTMLPSSALILAHHDICSNMLALTDRTCLLDISFECIEDKQAWYDYEQLFWSNSSTEIQATLDFYKMTHILYRFSLLNNDVLEQTRVNKIYSSWQCEPEPESVCYKDAAGYEVIRQRPLFVRMDDIWATNDDDRHGYSFENLNKTIGILKKHNTTALLAVTPFLYDTQQDKTRPLNSDERVVTLLKELIDEGWEIALHGYSHYCPKDNQCEFDGKTLAEDVAMLEEGKTYLEDLLDTEIAKFVSPKNRMPLNLGTALEQVGLQNITEIEWYEPIAKWYWEEATVEWTGFGSFLDFYDGIVLHYNTLTNERLLELDAFLTEKLAE
jgi:hypothetical protein